MNYSFTDTQLLISVLIIESGEWSVSEGHCISQSKLQVQVLLKYSFTDFVIHPESLRCVCVCVK